MARFGINDIEQAGKGVTYEKVPSAQDVIDKGGSPIAALGQAVQNLVDPSVSNGMRKIVTPATAAAVFESTQTKKMQENLGSLPNAAGIPVKVDVPAAQASLSAPKPVLGAATPAPAMASSHTSNAPLPTSTATTPAGAPQLPDGVKTFKLGEAIPGKGDVWRKGLDGKPYQVTGTNKDGTRFDNDGFSRQMAADRVQAGIDAKYAAEVDQARKYAEAQKDAYNNRSLQDHFNSLLYSRNTLGIPQNEMWKLAAKNFEAQQKNNESQARLGAEQYKADTTLAAHKYDADQRLTGTKTTAEAQVESARLGADSRTAAAITKAKQDAQEKEQLANADKIKSYLTQWDKLMVPDAMRPQLHEHARKYAYADANPDKAWVMTQSRDRMNAVMPRTINIGGKPTDTKALYSSLLQQFGEKEAASRMVTLVERAGGRPEYVLNPNGLATRKLAEDQTQPVG